MPRTRSTRAAMAALVAAIMGVSSPTSAQTPKIPIRAAYVPVVTWLPSWVAKDTGIFEKQGLDVSLTLIQNLGLLPGTLGKQFDIAPSTPPDLINAAAKGLDVVGIAGGFIESSSRRSIEVIVRKDSGINGPQDLKGKLVAAAALGSLMHIATLYWIKKNGVDPNSIRAVEVPFPNMADQLKAGRVDAVESIQPFVAQLLAAGHVSIGDPILAVSDPTHGTLWIADGTWARANPDIIKRWIASLTEAAEFIKKEPAQARAILGKYTKLPEQVVQTVPIPEYNAILDPAGLEAWVKALTELGQLEKPVEASRLVVKTN
jgi:NitT/TauT family transport system substrate-binding protein